MIRLFPITFVFLWSSAFSTSKVIVEESSPFTALAFRFAIVSFGFFLFSLYKKQKVIIPFRDILESGITGILFHGLYLGGVFFAIYSGLPAGVAALIVCLQPILTNSLAGPLLGEYVSRIQWAGIVLGFFGTFLVLGFDVGTTLPLIGIFSSIVALSAVTSATLWQKKISGKIPLSVNNMYQAISAFIFHFIIMLLFEEPYINFSINFLWAMSWQILIVSFGAFTILMYLIKIDSASKISALFFLVPPVSVLMAWFFLGETLSLLDILGLCIATMGVYIVMKKKSSN